MGAEELRPLRSPRGSPRDEDENPLYRPRSPIWTTHRQTKVLIVVTLVVGISVGVLLSVVFSSQAPVAARKLGIASTSDYSQLWRGVSFPRTVWPVLPRDWPEEPSEPALKPGRFIPQVKPSDVCVISADSRPLTPYLRPSRYSLGSEWPAQDLDMPSATALYNYYWSIRHGYRYIRLNATAPDGWSPMWSKMPAVIETVRQCKWTMFLDGDASTFQDMLQRWGFDNEAHMLIGLVPGHPEDMRISNLGFGIVRQTPRALEILQQTLDCPNKDPQCAHLKTEPLHDQSVFTDFIRSSITPDELIDAPCFDTNGAWCMGMPDQPTPVMHEREMRLCRGTYITHAHMCKEQVVQKVTSILLSEHLAWLSSTFSQRAGYLKVDGNNYLS